MKTLLALLTAALTLAALAPRAEASDRRVRYYDDCDRPVYYSHSYSYRQPVYYQTRPRVYYDGYYGSSRYNRYDDCYYPRRTSSRFSIYFGR